MAHISEIARFSMQVATATRWYRGLLGITPDYADSSIGIFSPGEAHILVHDRAASMLDGPPNEDHIAITVPDLDAAAAYLSQQGLALFLSARAYPWGRSAYLRDPDGRLVEVQEGGPSVARRVLLMAAELHRRGYQRLRVWPGMAPSGLHWRCTFQAGVGIEPARYSSGTGAACFGWQDAVLASPAQLADMFVQRFPELAAQAQGSDWAYVGWLLDILHKTDPDGLPIAFADWELPSDCWSVVQHGNLAAGAVARLPLPPT